MKPLKFSKQYSKLSFPIFTTIRKNTQTYQIGKVYEASAPNGSFMFEVLARRPLKKADITENMAYADADCLRGELLGHLVDWYGESYDDFVLLTVCKVGLKP